MDATTYTIIFMALGCALLAATLIPAPAPPADDERDLQFGLLTAGVVITTIMGALALFGLHVAAVLCGAVAWLIVMPALWLARAQDGWMWGGGEGDGSPDPVAPHSPPTPDDEPDGGDPAGPATAPRDAWAPAPAISLAPAPMTAEATIAAWMQTHLAAREREATVASRPAPVVEQPAWVVEAAPEPEPQLDEVAPAAPEHELLPDEVAPAAPEHELLPDEVAPAVRPPARALRRRGEQVATSRVAARRECAESGRRRRMNLLRRVAGHWRRWLWVAPPAQVTYLQSGPPAQHEARAHAPRSHATQDAGSRVAGL